LCWFVSATSTPLSTGPFSTTRIWAHDTASNVNTHSHDITLVVSTSLDVLHNLPSSGLNHLDVERSRNVKPTMSSRLRSTTGICAHDTARFFNYYPFENYYARRLGYFDSAQHRFVLDNFLVS